jgi:hypothetical protein
LTDFLLEPDQIEEPDRPERRSPPRLVATGLAPTAEAPVPRASKRPDAPPVYAPCPACQALVLRGLTTSGEQLTLDTGLKTYAVDWSHGEAAPVLRESRGYPEHVCRVLSGPR